jgi:glycosyltransferase involved in cell wall biosynthesis
LISLTYPLGFERMIHVITVGAHLGYDLSTTPLGGGGTVGTHLVRHWTSREDCRLVVVGSGPMPPSEEVEYVQIRWRTSGGGRDPSSLSVREYARFCEQFSREATEYLRSLAKRLDPTRACIVHHDVAEAPDFARLKAWGYRQVGIFHVDVIDYVAHIYLRNLVSAPTLAKVHRALSRARLARFLPLVLRLIFAKQEECVKHCDLLVVPSHPMADVLTRSYPLWARGKVMVIPWGAIVERNENEPGSPDIRIQYGVPEDQPVLLTLSRISPEKGQDLLLRALRIWEKKGGGDICLFICGAPAFMHGRRYFSRLLRLAGKLSRVKVHFPGYVAGPTKRAFLHAADLYVFPSRHESYGLTLAEALAAGLPVLATSHHAARELVRPEFGMVVEPDPRAIYRGLWEMLSDQKKLVEMGERARRFAQGLGFEIAAQRLITSIQDLLASSGS